MKKYIVTGGAGYIGSHTIVALAESGYEPLIVDNFCNSDKSVLEGLSLILKRDIKVYEGDCADEAFMLDVFDRESPVRGVLHFAALKAVGESCAEPLRYYKNNIDGLLVLLKVMLSAGTSDLVFSSSATVYGEPDRLPATEDSPVKPAESPYGNIKKISEDIIRDAVKSGAPLKSVALRYFNPVGAHPSSFIGELPIGVPNNLVPFITQTAAGLREKLTVFGNDYDTPDGTCLRDYIHVVDLAKAHVKALEYLDGSHESNFYDVFNVGTGSYSSVMEAIKTFETVTGQALKYEVGPRRLGDIEKLYADVDKANKVLNWKADLTLADAMRDAWNFQKSREQYKG